MSSHEVEAALRECIDREKAAFYPRFFKAGPGQYGEGDQFLGVTVPDQRKIARKFRRLPRDEIQKLLDSPYHESRLTGLLILVEQYERGDEKEKDASADFYLANLDRVNNWDLVDASAHKILGPHLAGKDRDLLDSLADSGHLWRQRIAIITTYYMIKRDDLETTFRIADKLIDHEHDLIHKAVGWMVREVGKRDPDRMRQFLQPRYRRMPRTMLRYAIEKLEPAERRRYLRGEV